VAAGPQALPAGTAKADFSIPAMSHFLPHPGRPALLLVGLLLALGACEGQRSLPGAVAPPADGDRGTARLLMVDPCVDPPARLFLVRDMLRAINAERARHRLPPLRLNDTLTDIAEFYSCRLVEGDFLSHTDPGDGSTVGVRAANFGYAALYLGENLAAGQRSVDQAMADWMNSADHRAVILDPRFTEVGLAVKCGGQAGICWVQEFGRPATEPAVEAGAAGGDGIAASRPAAGPPGPVNSAPARER
jgi:hypothetical protein